MLRFKMEYLVQWKNKIGRKPLILRGARQVGKTWLLKEFGRNHFRAYHHFDFERNKQQLFSVFQGDLNPRTIIRNLGLVANTQIDIENDLIIFDEIQNVPEALTSLKYFSEEMPQLALCTAGSLLGMTLSDVSFPVGKVEFLNLNPMNFEEFLYNYGNPLLYEAYSEGYKALQVSEVAHFRLLEVLKEYYVTGGMPEVVDTYLIERESNPNAFQSVRKKQNDLLNTLKADFSKHSGKINALHIASVYENIPLQLAQYINTSVKRYHFKNVVKGKKGYAELYGPIAWLENARLIIKVFVANRAELPLSAFSKENFFKLYLNDVGILGATLDIPPSAIILSNYGMTKGYFIENFAATELISTSDVSLFSWTEKNSEIEFLLVRGNQIIPVEAKSGKRTRVKSLNQYIHKYNPQCAFILSEKNFSLKDGVKYYIPLYYTGKLYEIDFCR